MTYSPATEAEIRTLHQPPVHRRAQTPLMPPRLPLWRRVVRSIRGAVGGAAAAQRVRHEARLLMAIDDRILDDIGFIRGDIASVARTMSRTAAPGTGRLDPNR